VRALIKSHIIEAWKFCVENDYKKQRINSERSLQSALWAHLYNDMPQNMRLFIEPTIKINGGKQITPDIVVCNKRNIISVLEIKYSPRVKPNFEKDIRNLAAISEHGGAGTVFVCNERYKGIEKDSTKYKLPKNVLYVWAGFHTRQKVDKYPLFSDGFEELKGRYLQLQTETDAGENPRILVNGRYID